MPSPRLIRVVLLVLLLILLVLHLGRLSDVLLRNSARSEGPVSYVEDLAWEGRLPTYHMHVEKRWNPIRCDIFRSSI
jgi:hypothetical protein